MERPAIKGFLVGLFGLALAAARAQSDTNFTRTEDVIYGRKFGMALTMDVFQPKQPNGVGIIYVVSSGWISSHEAISLTNYQAFLERGYTVFAVTHGSMPKFPIPEIIPDLGRSVRFIRHNAAKYGIAPDRLGICGGSAGGHLSLTIGTQGGPGDPNAKDPVDRESSAVQCVACFFPPTDFLNYGKPGADDTSVGMLKVFKPVFGPRADNPADYKVLAREISPIYYVTSNMPPTLIISGDADEVVPIQQPETFVEKAHEVGAIARLVVKPGLGHHWLPAFIDEFKTCADWFDEYLRGIKPDNAKLKDQP
jgi:acetyl esterase/lipase